MKSHRSRVFGLKTKERDWLHPVDQVLPVTRPKYKLRSLEESTAIPVECAAILIQVAVFAAQFPALAMGGSIVAVVQITAQVPTVMSDLGLIVTNVVAQTMVTVPGQRGCN